MVYKAMNGLSPQYWRLEVVCQLTSTAGRRRLRSSNVATCEVLRTRTSLGDRSFTVAGPRLWNNLPLHLTWLWTYFPGVPPVIEGAPVLLRTAAPSDCFCVPYKSAFTLHYIATLSLSVFTHRNFVSDFLQTKCNLWKMAAQGAPRQNVWVGWGRGDHFLMYGAINTKIRKMM